MLQRLRRLLGHGLSHPRLPFVLACLAVLLALPSLWVGWQMDDQFHRLILLGRAGTSPWNMFSLLRGDPAALRAFIDSGAGPWWTAEDLRIAFFRYLTVATHRLDYWLWPDSAPLMHAHSLVWFGLLVAAAAFFYRRFLGAGQVAGLAALAFAVDDAHAIPAAWIANRNALLATFFGLLCLLAHDRRRRGGWRPGAGLAPLCLALALASGEFAVATVGYLAAHVLFLDPAPWKGRLAAVLPHGAVLAAWAIVYKVFDFGVRGSGVYVDPGGDPRRFAAALLERAPFSLLGQWTPIPPEAGSVLAPRFPPGFWWLAAAFVAGLGLLLLPLLRRNAAARFLATGMLLSTVPISGTFPSGRLLFFVGLGAMGLFAQLVEGAFASASWAPASRLWRVSARAFAGFLLPVHLLLAPLLFPVQIAGIQALGAPVEKGVASLPVDPSLAGQDLIVVNMPEYLFYVTSITPMRLLAGLPAPRGVRALAPGLTPVEITRRDARTLDVKLERGLFRGFLSRLFRDAGHPLPPGHTVRLSGFTATVTNLGADGAPAGILYRFDRPLEDPSLRWVAWKDGVYVPFALPRTGSTVRLPPAVGPLERLGGWR